MDFVNKSKVLSAMAKCKKTEDIRYKLNSINITNDGFNVCDGCRFWKLKSNHYNLQDYTIEKNDCVLFSPEKVKRLLGTHLTVTDIEPSSITFLVDKNDLVTVQRVQGNFPDEEKLTSKLPYDHIDCTLALETLKQLTSIAIASGEKYVNLKIPQDETIAITAKIGNEVSGFFMGIKHK
jgi:DNA polymerase III sliding clamp (beta) subunit (PCNA family)